MSAMVQYREKHQSLARALDAAEPQMRALLPPSLSPERVIRVALMACARNPKLLECAQASLVRTIMLGAELGLEIGGALGEAYIVPFFNRKKQISEAQFIAGYKGLIKLALRSPRIEAIDPQLVYASDVFEYELGTTPRMVHKPAMGETKKRGDIHYAYAVAHYMSGRTQFVVMARDELEEIKAHAKSADSPGSPWKIHTAAMFRKCPIRRLANYIDVSGGLAKALEHDLDEVRESGSRHTPESLGGSRGEALKARLGQGPTAPDEAVVDMDVEALDVDDDTGRVLT